MKHYCVAVVGVWFTTIAFASCKSDSSVTGAAMAQMVDPCVVALVPSGADDHWGQRIAELQDRVRESSRPVAHLEQLGWAFVAKARISYDPGYYRLAESAARCIDVHRPGSAESLLLRGHVLHQLHQFGAAEALARKLVADRGLSFDFGLLGDVLLEQGKLLKAAEAYQTMMDQKPRPQAFVRAAQVRWLTGDVHGAIEAMEMSVASGATRDIESAAWAHVRLASYKLQMG